MDIGNSSWWVCSSARMRLVTSSDISWVWLGWRPCRWWNLPTFDAPSGRDAGYVSRLCEFLTAVWHFQFNRAFCALPDSVQFDQGSQTHSFRIREQLTALSSDKRPPKKDGHIYGFSHFIQRRDPSSKRGYQQVNINQFALPRYWLSLKRSLVILTQHQFPAFFIHLVSIFGPLFEQHGIPMLEAACHNMATWYVFISVSISIVLAVWHPWRKA